MSKKVKAALVLCSAIMMLAAAAWACPGSDGAKTSSAKSCGDKAQTVSMKSGEALGGGAEKDAKSSCAEKTACAVKTGEALGGGAEKDAKSSCADKSACSAKSGEALGGGSEAKAEGATCPVTGMSAAKAGSETGVYNVSDAKVKSDSGDACCPSGMKAEALGGGGSDSKKEGKDYSKKGKDYSKKGKDYTKKKSGEALGGGSDHKHAAYSVGDKVSDFTAVHSQSGESKSLSSLAGANGTVLIFWNQECPYIVDVQDRVNEFTKEYAAKGINVVAIDAGVNNSDEAIKQHAADKLFPILINKDSKIAAHYGATTTPEVFFLDKNMEIKYHGGFDSGTMRGATNPTPYVKNVSSSILKGENPELTQTKHPGCSLKYSDGVKPLKKN